jgi:hypothetical protein
MAAPQNTQFNLLNKEGVDVSQTYVISTTAPEYPAAPFSVGEHILGEQGTEWVFVLATAAIAAGATVSIDPSFNATPMTPTLANNLSEVGFAQVAIANGAYGWVATRGSQLTLLSKGIVTKNAALRISTSAGILINNATSATYPLITGVVVTTSYASTSTILRTGVATWPRAVQ